MGPTQDFHEALETYEADMAALQEPDTCVCESCVLDPELWRRIELDATRTICAFCASHSRCATFDVVADVIENVVASRYETVADSGAHHDSGEWSEETHDIRDVAEELLTDAVKPAVLSPLAAYVASRDQADYGWVRKADLWSTIYDWTAGSWRHLSGRLRMGGASGDLSDLPTRAIETLTEIRDVALDLGLFKTASPELWRCRQDSTFDLNARELGSPPEKFAAANRMSREGQSAFYGSTSLRCAVSEVAQGKDMAFCAGLFAPSRPLFHFDAITIPDPPSPFAEDSVDTTQALDFLRRFASTLSEPRMDGDQRHYVPTQVFTDFLLASPEDVRPDALRFASSLDGSLENWVVFVDNSHCTDTSTLASELLMILRSGSAHRHSSSREFLSGTTHSQPSASGPDPF